MKAGFVQFAPIFGEKEENLQKIDEIVLSHAFIQKHLIKESNSSN
jgi:predicted amidohydrolase